VTRSAASSTHTHGSQSFAGGPHAADAAGRWASLGGVGKTQYVRSGDGYVAFQVLSKGPADILVVNESVLPIEALQDNVHTASYLARLAEWGRVILFDRRGVGLSDPVAGGTRLTVDDWVGDALAVLDAVASDRAAVFSSGPTAGFIALRLAADFPGRVSFLSLYDAIARYRWAPDYPWGVTADVDRQTDANASAGGETPRLADRRGRFAAAAARQPGFAEWATTWLRRGAGPATIAAHADVLRAGDVRNVLPAITCPTLIINHADVGDGRFLEEHIADARYVELHDSCHLVVSAELDRVLALTSEFVDACPVESASRRVLTTMLVTDIVDSPTAVAAIGDRRWSLQLDRHHDLVRRHLGRFDGQEVKTLHDGVVATFDGPTNALLCALAISQDSGQQGTTVRAGVHTGEVELNGADVAGLAVQVAHRMCSLAASAQVLTTQSVVDLADGTELRFEHLGDHHIKGLRARVGVFSASPLPQRLLDLPHPPDAVHSTVDERLNDLSPRERDVLSLLVNGATNTEIASGLFISAATVKAHVSHLLVKLDCTNRVQLAILAHDADLATR
jgi:class 3 adenylate cyclase/DNA-binding CsgD family transcriptional regulator